MHKQTHTDTHVEGTVSTDRPQCTCPDRYALENAYSHAFINAHRQVNTTPPQTHTHTITHILYHLVYALQYLMLLKLLNHVLWFLASSYAKTQGGALSPSDPPIIKTYCMHTRREDGANASNLYF